MSFIPDAERVILFDVPTRTGALLPIDDLRIMRDAGCQTLLLTGADWNKFEPKPGKYDFGYIDEFVSRAHSAGMRALLPLWERVHTGFPLDWYGQTLQGSIPAAPFGPEYLISPWCGEAVEHLCRSIEMVIDHLRGSNVQVIPSLSRHGESVMPQDPRYYNPSARASWKRAGLPGDTPDQNLPGAKDWIRSAYLHYVIQQQRVCIPQHGEAWFMFHMPKRGRPNCGVDWFEDYVSAVPGATINHITFTYFANYAGLPELIQKYIKLGWREWVGAEYCEGLRDGNGERAREHGLRGVVVGPCHPFTRHTRVEAWMVDELRKAAR